MTNKIQALVAATVGGLFSFISWLATVPPETQSGILANLVELLPLDWRPTIGVWARSLMFFAGIYATHKASQSGPRTPPPNPPE